jgi:hypothetical protein
MGDTVSSQQPRPRPRLRRRVVLPVLLLILAAILAFALSRLGLHRIGNALTSAEPG